MSTPRAPRLVRDLSDAQLREAGALKWSLDPPGVIPAWVAEMDFALAEPVHRAVCDYAATGVFGYADPRGPAVVGQALAGFAQRRWGHRIDPERVLLVGDVMDGLALTLKHVAPPGPVIIPSPVYPPFFVVAQSLGREIRAVPVVRAAVAAAAGAAGPSTTAALTLDLDGIEAQARSGARTLLLCHPHNPVGRCWSRAELADLRAIVERYRVHVISDEIHAPLTLPGVDFVPYAAVATPEAAVTTLISATKAFSMPGLRCAQIVSHRAEHHAILSALHPVLNHSMNTIGQHASVAAYTNGEPWLDEVRSVIASRHASFRDSLGAILPQIDIEVAQATYLAWLDVSSLDVEDPVGSALAHGVRVDHQRQAFGPGSEGHVRVNLATSSQRLEQIVHRLARAWADGCSPPG
ncbi:MAG: aminotransferase class I/II-fold pyridoxal phosphate-dependent enzyme [Ornithinimicrobium sp.]